MIDAELLVTLVERAGLPSRVLDRVAGPEAEEAREALRRAPREATGRSARHARTLARVSAPVPVTLREVHPEWVAAWLRSEPAARELLTQPSLAPEAVWLARRAFGSAPTRAPGRGEAEEARRGLEAGGALALAVALDRRRPAVAAALAQLGERGAALKDADERLGRASGPPLALRDALEACRGVELRAPWSLELIGVAAQAPELAQDARRWRRLCHFLPRALGLAIAATLR
ncbi:MAG: hypothetical protein R3B48_27520 [Kofleriaceae bacterium]